MLVQSVLEIFKNTKVYVNFRATGPFYMLGPFYVKPRVFGQNKVRGIQPKRRKSCNLRYLWYKNSEAALWIFDDLRSVHILQKILPCYHIIILKMHKYPRTSVPKILQHPSNKRYTGSDLSFFSIHRATSVSNITLLVSFNDRCILPVRRGDISTAQFQQWCSWRKPRGRE